MNIREEIDEDTRSPIPPSSIYKAKNPDPVGCLMSLHARPMPFSLPRRIDLGITYESLNG